jgi:hypothetical protein
MTTLERCFLAVVIFSLGYFQHEKIYDLESRIIKIENRQPAIDIPSQKL